MANGIMAFTKLAGQAPANMTATVGVVTDFKTYQKSADKTKSMHQILAWCRTAARRSSPPTGNC